MKCLSRFLGKKKKNQKKKKKKAEKNKIKNHQFISTKFAQRIIKVNTLFCTFRFVCCMAPVMTLLSTKKVLLVSTNIMCFHGELTPVLLNPDIPRQAFKRALLFLLFLLFLTFFLCFYFSLLFSENALLSLLFSPIMFEVTKNWNSFLALSKFVKIGYT